MTPEKVTDQLNQIASREDFSFASGELVDHWRSSKPGFGAVESILRFMEEHPSLDYGAPGALVHFIEGFDRHGCEKKLLESLARKPTGDTAGMLYRMINGTRDPAEKKRLVTAMLNARSHPLADSYTKDRINMYLEYVGTKAWLMRRANNFES